MDAEADRLFSDLFAITQEHAVLQNTYCGEDLERWLLKVLIGMMCSGVVGNIARTTVKAAPAPWMLDILFGRREFNAGAGLGVFPSREPPEAPIVVTINSEADGTHVYGIRVCLLSINFHLMTAKTFHDPKGEYFHRPSRLEMPNGSMLNFDWLPGKAGAHLVLEPLPRDAG